ncbi:hypothetical protein GCM10009678_59570 [Actinomadura kijaniata]
MCSRIRNVPGRTSEYDPASRSAPRARSGSRSQNVPAISPPARGAEEAVVSASSSEGGAVAIDRVARHIPLGRPL